MSRQIKHTHTSTDTAYFAILLPIRVMFNAGSYQCLIVLTGLFFIWYHHIYNNTISRIVCCLYLGQCLHMIYLLFARCCVRICCFLIGSDFNDFPVCRTKEFDDSTESTRERNPVKRGSTPCCRDIRCPRTKSPGIEQLEYGKILGDPRPGSPLLPPRFFVLLAGDNH